MSFDGKQFASSAPTQPGVYVMYDANEKCLYVGKAQNLRKRISSYFRASGLEAKTLALVTHIERMEVHITRSDSEALLLEYNLIQELKPRYNVMMRDDKSYPYICLSDEEFPRLKFYRGSTRGPGRFFGPYANAGAVREVLNQIHKIIPLRQCEDSVFKNRTRPCLQYQIGRCSAPCTGEIDAEHYRDDIRQASLLLEGDDTTLDAELNRRMTESAERLGFEEAARYRDRIRQLRKIKTGQFVAHLDGDVDVLAIARIDRRFCIALLTVRDGRNLGQQFFLNTAPRNTDESEIMSAFISQHYLRHKSPGEIITHEDIDDNNLIQNALSEAAGRRVIIKTQVRGRRDRWLDMARINAASHLERDLEDRGRNLDRFKDLARILNLERLPDRLECFDVSHTMGEKTVASCVVFDQQGSMNSEYRRFNIRKQTHGDDYAAMAEALERRYRRVLDGEGRLPDMLLIDGGKGQLSRAISILDDLGVSGVVIVGVAKGLERRAGQERLFLSPKGPPTILDPASPASHLVQAIRDEAHRFAITGHRARRQKSRTASRLDEIPGIGPAKRRALLHHFGGLKEVRKAGVEDLTKVPGINRMLAEKIHLTLNP
ncbi:MAG: UvrABC system protein C [marine bacterium B5-7]|nr:MAG: UvrABC system protein C [marine bacterium B5-7]